MVVQGSPKNYRGERDERPGSNAAKNTRRVTRRSGGLAVNYKEINRRRKAEAENEPLPDEYTSDGDASPKSTKKRRKTRRPTNIGEIATAKGKARSLKNKQQRRATRHTGSTKSPKNLKKRRATHGMGEVAMAKGKAHSLRDKTRRRASEFHKGKKQGTVTSV